jgi:carbon-monoxide dehydrogenase medium subunit
VKPSPVTYHAPATVAEAVGLLAEHGDEAKVLGGGQSLLPLMNLRLAAPGHLVDATRIAGLGAIERGDGAFTIGAAVRQGEAEDDAALAAACPLLAAAFPHIAHREIRNAGTVCGSIAHGDAAAELPAVALALDAELVVHGPRGVRTATADGFFRSFLETDLEPDELLAAVRLPVAPPGTGAAFHELARRAGDFALAGVGAQLTMRDGVVMEARIACIGVGATALRARAAEQALAGGRADERTIADAARAAAAELEPSEDLHASAAFRRHAAETLMRRALHDAAARAEGNGREAS